jgi:limonene-1,2-epoxide hydrolase
MIQLETARNDAELSALRMLKAMEDGTLIETMAELCCDDFVWSNSGLPDLCGQQNVIELLSSGGFATVIPILAEMTHFTADLLHIASDGDVVFTERVDHHWSADGRDLMTPHICGVVQLKGRRIARLHDFYDIACYQQVPTPIQPGFSLAERHPERAAQAE